MNFNEEVLAGSSESKGSKKLVESRSSNGVLKMDLPSNFMSKNMLKES